MKKITVAQYLLARLKELGIDTIFGVPGDYNLRFLEYVEDDKYITWTGTCNELNGAYACDGYARIRGCGAMLTTFGVGELSAINGIAGSYTEFVPVVKITGMPALNRKGLLHHTLRAEDFCVFANIYRNVTVSSAILNAVNACSEIDRVLRDCWIHKRPVYIGIPDDVVELMVQSPGHSLDLSYPTSDPGTVRECVERIADLIRKSKRPILLTDMCALRHPFKKYINGLVDKTGLPVASMVMGKGCINESSPRFIGQYFGRYGDPVVSEQIEKSDCLITIGTMLTDFNTGGFTVNFNADVTVEIHSHYVKLGHSLYPDIYFDAVMPELISSLKGYKCRHKISKPHRPETPAVKNHITQEYFWNRIGKYLPENSIILAETGTSAFAAKDILLPDGAAYISQILWGSIGYTLGALLGASLADRNRKAILFEGDGSFQMTGQEVSTMLRNGLAPVIFLINNDGYTIERVIRGRDRKFNDIQMWDYTGFARALNGNVFTATVKTPDEMEILLKELPGHQNELCFIEVMMKRMDSPEALKRLMGGK